MVFYVCLDWLLRSPTVTVPTLEELLRVTLLRGWLNGEKVEVRVFNIQLANVNPENQGDSLTQWYVHSPKEGN